MCKNPCDKRGIKMRKRIFLAGCLIYLILGGCVRQVSNHSCIDCNELGESSLCQIAYFITDNLIDNLRIELNKEQIILVASFVDVNNVQRSSNFGRMLAEHMVSRWSQNGYTVVEVKLRDSIFIKEREGEFLLSRRLKDISCAHNAQAVVVGTYLLAQKEFYLAARVVQANNAKIISSSDVRLPLSDNLKSMLW